MQTLMNTKLKMVSGGLALFLAAATVPAIADDVTDSIDEASEAYKSGDVATAVESLNYAVQLLQQMKGDSLAKLLPEPLDGWEAKEAEATAVGAAMFGGGLTAERSYTKDKSRMKIQVVTDSPVLQGMLAMFTNPMFAASSGGKMTKINKQKAIVKMDKSGTGGEIQMVVKNRYMVTLDGSRVTKDELIEYAEAIDFSKFED
uniref:Uncharacterized protein n=1 Tax=uncultured Thiotrichaceae bacterium TaxID=298394 RepID=A0A6S6UBL1_9GAMM|nr:MAG: Unknown protein [uncultured Thiotrichaceae bacterium]